MTKLTRMSAKGQVVIPKDVRERMKWDVGTELEVVDGPAGVTLRVRAPAHSATDFDAALVRLRKTVGYRGPAFTDEEAKAAIDQMFRTDPKWGPPIEGG